MNFEPVSAYNLFFKKGAMTMSEAEIRINKEISTTELQRRWHAVRSAMTDQGIDVLIMQNTNQWLGGYVKWFTDVPAFNGYPTTVLFPREEEMTVINIGPEMDSLSDLTDLSSKAWAYRGIKNRFTAPYFPSLCYSNTYDAELIVNLLKPIKDCVVGFVGLGHIAVPFHEYIRIHLTTADFVDATDLVDNIKAIKSDEEIQLIKETAALQDVAMQKAFDEIRLNTWIPNRLEPEDPLLHDGETWEVWLVNFHLSLRDLGGAFNFQQYEANGLAIFKIRKSSDGYWRIVLWEDHSFTS